MVSTTSAAPVLPHTDARALYGIVPAAAAQADHPTTPPEVTLVPYGDIAGLTGPVPATRVRGLRSSLLSYTDLLDQYAASWPVLPLRFGTTVPTAAAVVAEVLAPHHDTFAQGLLALGQRAQFTVRARYLPDAIVAEVMAERPDAVRLQRRGTDAAARLRLGELIGHAVAGRRALDSNELAHRLTPYAAAVAIHRSTTMDLESLADVACLIDHAAQDEFEQAVANIAERWRDRVRIRLLGPMAPYHFADQLTGSGRPPC